MKNLDFKMRERFRQRQQDTDRQLERENKHLAKMKVAHYAADEFFDDEKFRECGATPEDVERIKNFFKVGDNNAE